MKIEPMEMRLGYDEVSAVMPEAGCAYAWRIDRVKRRVSNKPAMPKADEDKYECPAPESESL